MFRVLTTITLRFFLAWSAASGIVVPGFAQSSGASAAEDGFAAASPLRSVKRFRRELVLLEKGAELPVIYQAMPPKPLSAPEDRGQLSAEEGVAFLSRLLADGYPVRAGRDLLTCTVLTIDRRTKSLFDAPETLIRFDGLTLTGDGCKVKGLGFDALLPTASKTGDVLYVYVSDYRPLEGASRSEDDYNYFVGKLERVPSRLTLVRRDRRASIVVDPLADSFYSFNRFSPEKGIIRTGFKGKVDAVWYVDDEVFGGWSAPGGKSLLLDCTDGLRLLNFESGKKELLRIGRPAFGNRAVWRTDKEFFCLEEKASEKHEFRAALLRVTAHRNERKELVSVSYEATQSRISRENAPVLSVDGTWLIWPAPVKRHGRNCAFIIDLETGEFRVVEDKSGLP